VAEEEERKKKGCWQEWDQSLTLLAGHLKSSLCLFIATQSGKSISFELPGQRMFRIRLKEFVKGSDGLLVPARRIQGHRSEIPGINEGGRQLDGSVQSHSSLVIPALIV
jgi:hypothetical protein